MTSRRPVSRALPGQHARPARGAVGRAGAPGDARRHPRRGPRPARRGRVRSRLVPRRLADRRGGAERLAIESRVARRVPPRPPRLPRGRRLRLLLRDPRLQGPRGLRRGRGARAPAPAPARPRPAPDSRLRSEPHGAGPSLGGRASGLVRRRDGGASRLAAPELPPPRDCRRRPDPRLRPRPVLRRLVGHAAAELRQPRAAGGDARRANADRPASATASGATWRCSSFPKSSRGPGGSPPPPFWPRATQAVRAAVPGFLFLAEVYWDLEWTLLQQGFDYAYDKRLYDRLEHRQARPVREHLYRGPRLPGPHGPLPREPRRAAGRRYVSARRPSRRRRHHLLHAGPSLLPPGPARGQAHPHPRPSRPRPGRAPRLRDRRLLRRPPRMPEGPGLSRRRLAAARVPVRVGRKPDLGRLRGLLLDRTGRAAPPRRRQLRLPRQPVLRRAAVERPRPDATWRLADRLGPARYDRSGDDLAARGLYLDLPAWGHHVFEVRASAP